MSKKPVGNRGLRRSRIFVRDGSRIIPIQATNIERVQGADDYVTIFTSAKEYLVSIRLSDMEEYLATAGFLRVHRSHLINIEYIAAIEPYDAARLQVVIKSGARIVATRNGSKLLRELAL
jgi:two-component system LytT family response regulator